MLYLPLIRVYLFVIQCVTPFFDAFQKQVLKIMILKTNQPLASRWMSNDNDENELSGFYV